MSALFRSGRKAAVSDERGQTGCQSVVRPRTWIRRWSHPNWKRWSHCPFSTNNVSPVSIQKYTHHIQCKVSVWNPDSKQSGFWTFSNTLDHFLNFYSIKQCTLAVRWPRLGDFVSKIQTPVHPDFDFRRPKFRHLLFNMIQLLACKDTKAKALFLNDITAVGKREVYT